MVANKRFLFFFLISFHTYFTPPKSPLLVQQSSTVLVAEVYVVKLISHSTETAMFSHPFFIIIILKVLKAVYSPLQIVFFKNSILKSGCILVTGCRKPQPYFFYPP